MRAPRPIKLLLVGAGSLLVLVVVAGYLSAPHFYLTRSVFWGESDYKDLERFPALGVALLGLSFFVGGFEGSAVEGPLLARVEAYSALVGILVVLGALVWQVRRE